MADIEIGKRRALLDIAHARGGRRTERDLDTFLERAETRTALTRDERLRIVPSQRQPFL